MPIPKSLRIIALSLAALLVLAACDRAVSEDSVRDLSIARDAYNGGYFLEAETAYERYLQSDPQGKHRLEAWTRLVEINTAVKGDLAKGVNLLETASLEFATRPDLNWPLLFRLGELYEQTGQRKKAMDAWGRCLDTAGKDTVRAVQAQMRMAVAGRALGQHDQAVEMLSHAVSLVTDPELKARAMYELAQTYGLAWNWPKCKAMLGELLGMDKAPQDLKVMATFLLAEAYEYERDIPKARELLLSIKDTYPNPEVIVARLANLGKRDESPAIAKLQPGDSIPEEVNDAQTPKARKRGGGKVE